jgi:hypothetical protein
MEAISAQLNSRRRLDPKPVQINIPDDFTSTKVPENFSDGINHKMMAKTAAAAQIA